MARVNGITQFLPATHTTIQTTPLAFTRWHHPNEVAHIRYSLLLNLSTSEVRKAELA